MASIVRRRCERAASMYLAVFFLAVAAAPHRHLNDLEDLLLDQRSDSGILIEEIGPASASEALALRAIRLVPDVPCLACFSRDFVCAPTATFLVVAELGPLPLLLFLPDVAKPREREVSQREEARAAGAELRSGITQSGVHPTERAERRGAHPSHRVSEALALESEPRQHPETTVPGPRSPRRGRS